MAVITSCWCTDVALLVVGIFVGLYFFYKQRFKLWAKHNIPHTNPNFMFGDLGLKSFRENFVMVLDRIYKSFEKEKVVGLWFMNQPILLVRDLDLIRDVLVKDFMTFQNRGIPYDEEIDPLSAHLFSLEGSKWRNLRAKLSPTFTSGKMKMMFPILVNCGKEMVDILEQKAINREIVEMKEIFTRLSTDIIASCAFGIEINSLKNPDAEFLRVGKGITEPRFSTVLKRFIFMVPWLAKKLRLTILPKDTSDFFINAVRDTIDYREKNDVKRNDFLQLLIQLKNKGKLDDVDEIKETENTDETDKAVQKFTFNQVASQAFLFFFAGQETSSTAMVFALYEMALHPEIQERVRDEIRADLAKHDGKITYEAIFGMEYLGRVIDETLRKYPPALVLFRQTAKEYKIPDSDIVIPKGIMCQVPTYSLHMDPKYFPEPERFDPDRFTEEAKAKRHRYSYLPFGEGPRNCIGMRFGLMQTRVGLVQLLLNYRFEICEKTPIPIKFSIVNLTPKEGISFRISKLN